MRHVHSLRFDALEDRRLLSRAHAAVAHHAPPAPAVPVMVDGTLTVDNRMAASTENDDGSSNSEVPVSGQLGAMGEVHGEWYETVDPYGDNEGPDLIQLHNAKGSFIISFNNETPGPAHPAGRGAIDYVHPQQVQGGTRAYARAAEKGTIELVTNPAKTAVASMVLSTQST